MSKKPNRKIIVNILNKVLHTGLYQQFSDDNIMCIGYIISKEELTKIAEYIGVEIPKL